MFEELELYVLYDEQDGELDWSPLFDVANGPSAALDYMAQFIGERLPEGRPDDQARQWLIDQPNSVRGTVDAIYSTAKRSLNPPALVTVIERTGGVPAEDHLTVITYTDQTPDPGQTLADLMTVVPADIVLHYSNASSQGWTQLKVGAHGGSWNTVKSFYSSWAAVAADQTSGIIG
jgi:hypothetical protein